MPAGGVRSLATVVTTPTGRRHLPYSRRRHYHRSCHRPCCGTAAALSPPTPPLPAAVLGVAAPTPSATDATGTTGASGTAGATASRPAATPALPAASVRAAATTAAASSAPAVPAAAAVSPRRRPSAAQGTRAARCGWSPRPRGAPRPSQPSQRRGLWRYNPQRLGRCCVAPGGIRVLIHLEDYLYFYCSCA